MLLGWIGCPRSWIRNAALGGHLSTGPFRHHSRRPADCLARPCRCSRRDSPSHDYEDCCWNLIEDNTCVRGGFPMIILGDWKGGCTGNVVGYNYRADLDTGSDIAGGDISVNHGPHNMMNLFEGNVGVMFQSDGYFGSSSHNTVFRNLPAKPSWFGDLHWPPIDPAHPATAAAGSIPAGCRFGIGSLTKPGPREQPTTAWPAAGTSRTRRHGPIPPVSGRRRQTRGRRP